MQWLNTLKHFKKYWLTPVANIQGVRRTIRLYAEYLRDWRKYSQLVDAEKLSFGSSYPCIFDSTENTPFDAHYLYQSSWAANRIMAAGSEAHMDIGSDVRFVCQLTSQIHVIFVDIRPVQVHLDRFACISGHLLALPFSDRSIQSLSCLHVAEHVGLGRYGDELNPHGTQDACLEITRVLAPGGHLFFSVPVGVPRLNFNAHRVHSAHQICEYFKGLDLIEFSLVTDQGEYWVNVPIEVSVYCNYACGLFYFRAH